MRLPNPYLFALAVLVLIGACFTPPYFLPAAVTSAELRTPAYIEEWCERWSHGPMMHNIDAALYLGNICAAHNESLLQHHNISVIVNMCIKCPNKFPEDHAHIATKNFPIHDAVKEDLLAVLADAVAHIEDNIRQGRVVLVHCMAGISRSGAVAAAYLMKTKHVTVEGALELIRKERAIVNPNSGFMRQLAQFGSTLTK